MSNDNTEILHDLDAGIFAQKISEALTEAGRAAIHHDKNAKVVIELTYEPISNTRQCQVKHKLKSVIPHSTGQVTDEDEKKTPIYIHQDGKQAVTPESQTELNFN